MGILRHLVEGRAKHGRRYCEVRDGLLGGKVPVTVVERVGRLVRKNIE